MLYSGYTTYQLTKSQAQSYCNTGAPAFPVADATIDDVHSVRLLTACVSQQKWHLSPDPCGEPAMCTLSGLHGGPAAQLQRCGAGAPSSA